MENITLFNDQFISKRAIRQGELNLRRSLIKIALVPK